MSVVINDVETNAMVDEMARRTGETGEEAVRQAVRERVERVLRSDSDRRLAAIRLIQDQIAAMPTLDFRTEDEILGYNEQGLFD